MRPPRSPQAVLATLGIGLILAAVAISLPSCATSPDVIRPELVRIIVQTDRSIQIEHPGNGLEVATAVGWAPLATPVVVCVSFSGQPGMTVNRTARLLDYGACVGGQ